MDPRMSYSVNAPRMSIARPSVMTSNMIPILSPEEIQKLETLKRASIMNPEQETRTNMRLSYRPSIKPNFRQSVGPIKSQTPLKNKLVKKAENMKAHNQKDQSETKRTQQPSFTSKTSKRKDRAIQEKEEGFFEKCCLYGENQADQNPFRRARQSYLNH